MPSEYVLTRGGDDREVLAAGEVAEEARLLDDRADAGERLRPLRRDGVAEQLHGACRRGRQAEEHADESGLAGAVRAEVAEGGPAGDAEVDAADDRPLAEALRQSRRLDDVRRLDGVI